MPSYPAINDREFNLLKKITENTAELASGGGGGGGGSWGEITGTLSNQTDLQSALDDKMNLVGPYRLILDGDSHEISQDDFVVNYADSLDNSIFAYDPTGRDGAHVILINTSGDSIDFRGNTN